MQCQIAAEVNVEIKQQLSDELQEHHANANVFYTRKASARESSQRTRDTLAVAFDYWKNLPCPNVTTNDVYYRRQLSVYTFNIHVLTTSSVYLYTYDESVARKGADDVCSMLEHFCRENVPDEIQKLKLFCDGCAGQNKNWTMIRFLYYLVHYAKRFEEIRITFPVRGHSYMECDRDMGAVNQSSRAETPADWHNVFAAARKRPSPYHVVEMEAHQFVAMTAFLKPFFRATCPIGTRPVREFVFRREQSGLLLYRENWHGQMLTAIVRKRGRNVDHSIFPDESQRKLLYTGPLPISQAKYQDLQVLKRFCSPATQQYFTSLQACGDQASGDSDPEHDA